MARAGVKRCAGAAVRHKRPSRSRNSPAQAPPSAVARSAASASGEAAASGMAASAAAVTSPQASARSWPARDPRPCRIGAAAPRPQSARAARRKAGHDGNNHSALYSGPAASGAAERCEIWRDRKKRGRLAVSITGGGPPSPLPKELFCRARAILQDQDWNPFPSQQRLARLHMSVGLKAQLSLHHQPFYWLPSGLRPVQLLVP